MRLRPVVTPMRIRYNHNVNKLQPMLIAYFPPCRSRHRPLCGAGTRPIRCRLFLHQAGKEPVSSQPIPLTPVIWFSPSVTTAEVPYLDGCGETRSVTLTDALVASVPKKLTGVFTGVTAQSQLG